MQSLTGAASFYLGEWDWR